MRVLIAPNAFKGCLSAAEAAEAMARGVLRAAPEAALDLLPISDGGDGLIEALLAARGGRKVFAAVEGPLGGKRWAAFALLPGGEAAVEMAQASGLALLPEERRDIWRASSFGTGQLILKALETGARTVLVGIGGSATNDAGAGMAQALGARLLDAAGRPVARGPRGLRALASMDVSALDPRVRKARIVAVSDVTNPLLGPRGSARVYGPQKGATAKDVSELEAVLRRFARLVRRDLGRDVARIPGAGAAGGLGAGLLAFAGARMVPGGPFVLQEMRAPAHVRDADLVLTGEGRLDAQSLYGKAPVALAELAKRAHKPLVAICGSWDPALKARLRRRGIARVIALADRVPPARALREAPRLLAEAAAAALRARTVG